MGLDDEVKYGICALCGLLFGIAAEKGRVHEPHIIRTQMDFSNYTMLKMFLTAAASGMAGMSLLTIVSGSGKRRFQDARASFISCLRNKGYISATIGGGLLGAGMTLSGACPGMVLVQVGTQLENSLLTFCGGLLGAVIYSLLENSLVSLTKPSSLSSHNTVDTRGSYSSTALPLAAVMSCGLAALEITRPWTGDVSGGSGGFPSLYSRAWPPYVSGALIGLLQVPLIMTISDTLGSSSSYCTIVSQCLVTRRLRSAFPYLDKYRRGFENWWQVMFVAGAVAGGFISATASGTMHLSSPVTRYQALIGGATMLIGARLAGGCTSGHGLSGMSMLVYNSIAAVASMFGGAMLTRAAMKQGYFNF